MVAQPEHGGTMEVLNELERRLAESEAHAQRLERELAEALARNLVLETRLEYITDSVDRAMRIGQDSDPVNLDRDLPCLNRVGADPVSQ